MKRFVISVAIFVIPVLAFYALVEYYSRTQTSFGLKKKYLESNLDSIQILILGSSHNQNGINPEYIQKKTCNLAFAGQPFAIDYYIMKSYLEKMPRLQTVFFEISPQRFYLDLDSSNWNGHIYSILYGIDYKAKSFSLKNYSLVYSDYEYFTSLFKDYCNPWNYRYHLNQSGFITNDFNDRFFKLNFDTAQISKTFKMEYQFGDQKIFARNIEFLKMIIEECKRKKVELIFVNPPLYKTFITHIPIQSGQQVTQTVNRYAEDYQIRFLDFSTDTRFNIYDFKNDNHLNSNGARKFTLMLDSIISRN